jgi:hypothetical protein
VAIEAAYSPKKVSFEGEKLVWLRLTNNSPWMIKVCMKLYRPNDLIPGTVDGRVVSVLRDGSEVGLCYGVEKENSERIITTDRNKEAKFKKGVARTATSRDCEIDFYTSGNIPPAWIASGSSVVFPVRSEWLDNKMIYVLYNYDWDENERTLGQRYHEHRIYFSGDHLKAGQ